MRLKVKLPARDMDIKAQAVKVKQDQQCAWVWVKTKERVWKLNTHFRVNEVALCKKKTWS